MTRLSGCEDTELGYRFGAPTVDCPRSPEGNTLALTIYGRNFFLSSLAINYNFLIDGKMMPAQFRLRSASGSFQLIVHLNTTGPFGTLPLKTQLNATLTWNLTLTREFGSSSLRNALSIATTRAQPIITKITGCDDAESVTRDCSIGAQITLVGSHFVFYEPSVLQVVGVQNSGLLCRGQETPVGALICDYSAVLPISYYTPYDVLLFYPDNPVYQFKFQNGLSFAPRSLSSTGSNGGGGRDISVSDGMDGMKYSLMVMMLVALGVVIIATSVYLSTWWAAQRRAFVSSNGPAAAVDVSQILLH